MKGEQTVRDYVTLVRGITYKGNLVGKPGPALLGLGSIHPGGGFREGDYKTYGGDCPPKLMLKPGDLFVSLKGATKDGKMIGSVARVPVSVPCGRLTQDTVKLEFRTAEKAKASSYLYWLLRTPQYRAYCDGRAMGSAVVALSRDDFLEYPVPSFSGERKSIVEVLERIEDKIELNRRMNATLEAMARALFKSWFVDFDPIRAKLDGRLPVAMDSATPALFPDHFGHDADGVVPKGWCRKRWGDIATLEYGKSLRDYRESGGRYRVYGTNGPIGFHDEALCDRDGIIIGRKGAYRGVHFSPDPFFVIDTAFYLKPKAPLDLKWAYYELLRFDINGMDSGSAIPSTSRDDFYGIPVIVPPPAIQEAFGKIAGEWFDKIFANNRQSHTLATLRDTLLPKLLSGELIAIP